VDLQIEFSETAAAGPFEPLARISIAYWSELEAALVEATDGRPPIGFYRACFASGDIARLLVWDGEDGTFQLLTHDGKGNG
jgi:hypothetical protein